MSEWIKCSERMPNNFDGSELIVYSFTGYRTALSYSEEAGFYSDEETARDGYWNRFITHWQPLPAPPEAE